MNKDKILQKYSHEYYRLMFGLNPKLNATQSYSKAALFIDKYGLDDTEYSIRCIPDMQKVFKCSPNLPFDVIPESASTMFQEGFSLFGGFSSPLFWEDAFVHLMAICRVCGDDFFYIVEDETCEETPEMAFKLRFPVGISWKELTDGGFVSDVVLNMHHNNYFVFGNSGQWGRWCSFENSRSDYEVIGYKTNKEEILAYIQASKLKLWDKKLFGEISKNGSS